MYELIIIVLTVALISTTLIFNYFINKICSVFNNRLKGHEQWHQDLIGVWTSWAGPFMGLSKENMADTHKLIRLMIETDDPEEQAACKKALAEILKNDPLIIRPTGVSHAD